MADNNELIEETYWMFEKLKILKKMGGFSQDSREKYRKKIMAVLEYYRVYNYEMIYIWTYKKNEVLPELNLDDLWNIYEMDNEWSSIYPKRKALTEKLENL